MNGKSASAFLCLLLTAVFALTAAPRALAQIGGTGSIQGVITDSTGAVIPGATVTATNVATGVKTERQTTGAGLYVLAPLPPGEYKITVSATGFRQLEQDRVIVDALSTVGLNLTLQVGTASETVTITSAPAQLNTSDPRLGTTIRNELYTNLPLAMGTAVAGSGIGQGPRNPGAFIFLLPGVSEGNRWGTINGAQGFSKDVFIEGVPITDPIQQGEGRTISLGVSVEAVEQFQVETSGTGVEFNGQGSENYTIKSGTNRFHGSGFEFLRNTVLDARGFFPAVRPVEHQNEFGGTIGGPILKNKLFFFFSYDGWRYRVTSPTQFATVPTLKMRQGDFSELPVAIYDPLTTVAVTGGFARTAFPGNVIPANRISAISKVYQSLLPAPTNSGLQNNYLGSVPVAYNNDSFNTKVDYNLTASHRLSGIYTHGKRSQPGPYRETSSSIPQTVLPLPYTDTRLVVEIPTVVQAKHNWTINSSLVNQVNFSFNHFFVPITNATSDGKWASKSGLKGLPAGDASDAFLEAAFAGANAPSGWRGTNSRDFEDNNYNYTLQESLLWVRNKHSFKFGFQYQHTSDHTKTNDTGSLLTTNFNNLQTAGFNATGGLLSGTGNAYASFLLGALNSATVNEDSIVLTVAQFSSYAWWVADDYKVNSRLTVNLGLRHDIMLPYVEAGDHFTYLDPTAPNPAAGGRPGALRFGGNYAPDAISCHCDQIINTYYKAFGPRVGFAFSLNDKTVLRGGYGLFYSPWNYPAAGTTGWGQIGYSATTLVQQSTSGAPTVSMTNPFPAGLVQPTGNTLGLLTGTGGDIYFVDPNKGAPRVHQFSADLQRELPGNMSLSLGYTGAIGQNLSWAGSNSGSTSGYININQLDPKYQSLPANYTLTQVPNPFFGVASAGQFATLATIPRGQLMRPFPEFGNVYMMQSTGAHSAYNAGIISLKKRITGLWGGQISYTYSRLNDNQFGEANYYSVNPGLQNNYTVIPGSAYYNPDAEYGRSLLDSPHKLVIAPTLQIPLGQGHKFAAEGWKDLVLGGWSATTVITVQSGFPIGVTQNLTTTSFLFGGTPRPNVVPGQSFLTAGDVTDRISANTNDNVYLNPAAFSAVAANQFGNAPRTLPGILSPMRNNVDLSVSKSFRTVGSQSAQIRIDALNLFNEVQWAAPASTAFGNSAFGQITNQANNMRMIQFTLRYQF